MLITPLITPGHVATLYGSRDSFIPYYSGRFPTQELEDPLQIIDMSGTSVRKRLSIAAQSSQAWRAGAIWATHQNFPRVISTVDAAIVDFDKRRLLLAKKPDEDGWRFVGGYEDTKDNSSEHAVIREVQEETGLSVHDPEYLGSFNIDDWRLKKSEDKIRSKLFLTPYLSGGAKANDDIADTHWFNYDELLHIYDNMDSIMPEHQEMLKYLLTAMFDINHKRHNLFTVFLK